MSKKIAIFGATGLIGKNLSRILINRGDNVIVFARSLAKAEKNIPNAAEYVLFDQTNDWRNRLSKVDAVVNLAGEPVLPKRWNDRHKINIKKSRIETTCAIVNALSEAELKPEVFVSVSAVGYYGTSSTKEFDENSPTGQDFFAEVTKEWEKEARRVEEYGIRYIGIRLGVVLAIEGGALARMLPPFKFFIGGPLGNGRQWFPWIHIDDAVGLFVHAIDNPNVNGALNGTAPQSLTMKEFSKALGKVMHRPSIMYVPGFILRILFGEGADMLLKGTNVIPKRTIDTGYRFNYDNIDVALKNLLKY